MSSQGTPRKFSEKIAIMERKQTEDAEAFKSVMQEVRPLTTVRFPFLELETSESTERASSCSRCRSTRRRRAEDWRFHRGVGLVGRCRTSTRWFINKAIIPT